MHLCKRRNPAVSVRDQPVGPFWKEISVELVIILRGAVASWLVRSTPDRAVRVRDLAGDIALCS